MAPGSWQDPGKILARFSPGSRRDFGRRDFRFPPGCPPGFPGGNRNSGGQNLAGFPARFWFPASFWFSGKKFVGIRAQKLSEWYQFRGRRYDLNDMISKSPRVPGENLAWILGAKQNSRRESCRDSWREAKFPAAKISPGSRRESCRDSWREAKFPAAKISPGSRRESCRDSWREAKFPEAKISPGSRQESCREAKFPTAEISVGSCRARHDPGRNFTRILS